MCVSYDCVLRVVRVYGCVCWWWCVWLWQRLRVRDVAVVTGVTSVVAAACG